MMTTFMGLVPMLLAISFWGCSSGVKAFTANSNSQRISGRFGYNICARTTKTTLFDILDDWNGEVVSNDPDGKIKGCKIQNVGESITDWIVTIDGEEADLGKFSDAIYRKVTADAKKQQFQGFRPGTIPPHIEPTYRAFAMDECARETVLEALQQNNIRPFEDARTQFKFENFWIPPAKPAKKKKKSKKRKKNAQSPPAADDATVEQQKEPEWRSFEGMKEAIDAGWRPGQSFSFVAKNVKGQKVRDDSEVEGAKPVSGFQF